MLCVAVQLPQPVEMEVVKPIFNRRKLGPALKKDQKPVIARIEEICEDMDGAKALAESMDADGQVWQSTLHAVFVSLVV